MVQDARLENMSKLEKLKAIYELLLRNIEPKIFVSLYLKDAAQFEKRTSSNYFRESRPGEP